MTTTEADFQHMDLNYLPEKIRLGHKHIDFQHEILFFVMSGVRDMAQGGAGADSVDTILSLFKNYVGAHFKYEEEQMARLDYPDMKEHLAQHREFKLKLLDFERDFTARESDAGIQEISQRMFEFLMDWLGNHISVTDRKLCAFLESQG